MLISRVVCAPEPRMVFLIQTGKCLEPSLYLMSTGSGGNEMGPRRQLGSDGESFPAEDSTLTRYNTEWMTPRRSQLD